MLASLFLSACLNAPVFANHEVGGDQNGERCRVIPYGSTQYLFDQFNPSVDDCSNMVVNACDLEQTLFELDFPSDSTWMGCVVNGITSSFVDESTIQTTITYGTNGYQQGYELSRTRTWEHQSISCGGSTHYYPHIAQCTGTCVSGETYQDLDWFWAKGSNEVCVKRSPTSDRWCMIKSTGVDEGAIGVPDPDDPTGPFRHLLKDPVFTGEFCTPGEIDTQGQEGLDPAGSPINNDSDDYPNYTDDDIDGNGTPNGSDSDVDGDGTPNGSDSDVDDDGFTNGGDFNVDGDDFPNYTDPDIDGDGIPNGSDGDMDGDGFDNGTPGAEGIDEDLDNDGDGKLNDEDPTPNGVGSEADADCTNQCIPDSGSYGYEDQPCIESNDPADQCYLGGNGSPGGEGNGDADGEGAGQCDPTAEGYFECVVGELELDDPGEFEGFEDLSEAIDQARDALGVEINNISQNAQSSMALGIQGAGGLYSESFQVKNIVVNSPFLNIAPDKLEMIRNIIFFAFTLTSISIILSGMRFD